MITHINITTCNCQVALGQLTVVLGENNAGKSAILRLLPAARVGKGAQTIALADSGLLKRVSEWYLNHCGAEVVRVAHSPEADRLILRRPGQRDMPFLDAGEGLQHAFPVLVGAEQLRTCGGLLAVEEPEVHLHPRMQRALADHLVEVVRAQPLAQVVLSTHSEVFLLSALYAAVEHGVSVRIHWVEDTQVREVELDADGRPRDTTLTDAFDTVGVQRRAIINARRKKMRGL